MPLALATGAALAGGKFGVKLGSRIGYVRGTRRLIAGHTDDLYAPERTAAAGALIGGGIGAYGPGAVGWKLGRKLEGKKKPKVAKSDYAALIGGLEVLDKRQLPQKPTSLASHIGSGSALGGTIMAGGLMSGEAGPLAIGTALGGATALVGGAGGAVVHAIKRRRYERAAISAGKDLSEKEHQQRIAAAKARWLKAGHHDIDPHHDWVIAQAGKAFIGRRNKLLAAHGHRLSDWENIAEAIEAHDKVKPHLPKGTKLTIDVRGSHRLYNPQHISRDDFTLFGEPKRPMYGLHPDEVDNWIRDYGKNAKAVKKLAPGGLITHIYDMQGALAA